MINKDTSDFKLMFKVGRCWPELAHYRRRGHKVRHNLKHNPGIGSATDKREISSRFPG